MGDAGGIGDAAGIGDGGGITERAGGIRGGGLLGVAAIVASSQWLVEKTMYHRFMNVTSSKQWQKPPTVAGWDFLTNHAHVLTCVANDPGVRLRDIATAVGITERAAHRILSELVEEGYVLRERQGRRNHYQVVPELPLRHPLVQEREVGDLLKVLLGSTRPAGEQA